VYSVIDPRELRIGNLVSIKEDQSDLLCIVQSISASQVTVAPVDRPATIQTCSPEEIMGIPISTSLLEIFGFERKKITGAIQYEYDGFVVEGDEDGFGLSPIFTYWIRMSHVHQLMNQFFALSGFELVYAVEHFPMRIEN
jgi:hypothetical protein